MNRAPQLAIIVSAGLLLFVASQWPRYAIPGCIAMFLVIWIAATRMRPGAPAAPGKRNIARRIAGALVAAALLLWVLFSLRKS